MRNRRRRRAPGGRLERPPSVTGGGGFRPGVNARRYSAYGVGEDLESVSRELGITAARASQWRDQFLAAGQAGLKSRAPDARDEEHPAAARSVG